MDTYTDTWGKMVRFIEIKKFTNENDVVYSIIPDFETIQIVESEVDLGITEETAQPKYTEHFHLDDTRQNVRDIYMQIKDASLKIDPHFIFNPQKYYISIRNKKNKAYLNLGKKKIRCNSNAS